MRRLGVFVLCLSLVSTPAWSQIPVTDAGNLVVNTTTSLQAVITAVNMVLSVANQALELTPVDDVVIAASFEADMAALSDVLAHAEGLMDDVTNLRELFNPSALPTTLPEMLVRIADMNDAIRRAREYALEAQSLIRTLVSTVYHLTGLVNSIAAFIGNMQGNQTLVQVNASMGQTLATLTMQMASEARDATLTRMRDDVVRAMDKEITRQYYGPWFEVRN